MFERIANIVTNWPRATIAAILIVIVIASVGLGRLTYVGTSDSGFPTHSRISHDVRLIEKIFKGDNTLALMVSGGSLDARIRTACRLVRLLETRAEVVPNSVLSATSHAVKSISLSEGSMLVSDMSDNCVGDDGVPSGQFAARLNATGPQRPFLVGANGQLFVYVDLKVENGAYAPLLDTLAAQMRAAAVGGAKITIGGQPIFLAALQNYSQRIAFFFPFIILVIALLHYEALRSLQAVFIPLLTGFLATVLAFGIAGWVGMPINEYTSTAPILVLAVAAGHSVQLLKRYMEELGRLAGTERPTCQQNLDALRKTLAAMGPVLSVAAIAASLCLFSLLALDVPAIGQFGFVAGFGILCALVLELTLIPALRALIPPPKLRGGFGQLAAHWEAVLGWIAGAVTNGSQAAMATGLLAVVLVLALGTSLVSPSHSVTTVFSPSTAERRSLAEMQEAKIGQFPLDVVFDGKTQDGAFEPAILEAANDLGESLRHIPEVRSISSPTALMSFLKCKFSIQEDCTQVKVVSREEGVQLWETLYGGGAQSPLIDEGGRYLRVRAFLDTDETNRVAAIASEVGRFAQERHLNVLVGGAAMTPKAIADGVVNASIEKVVLILAVVALVGLVVFRSFLAGALFVIPSALTALATYGFLGWSHTPLNVATASISALAVGVGVDYLVYLTFRVREELLVEVDWNRAITAAIRSAGGASLCVGTAVSGGYLVLLASRDFMVHQWLATLIPLSMVASLAGALVVYPFALRMLKPKFLTDRQSAK